MKAHSTSKSKEPVTVKKPAAKAAKPVPKPATSKASAGKKAAPVWGEAFEPHAEPLRALEEVARTIWPAK